MNRLQKKCFIATVGLHLLLVVILFVGPAFFYSRPKPDDSQVLDVIPADVIEAAFNSGVKNAQPPAPVKIVPPPPPIQAPVQPQTPPPPAPPPKQTFVEKIEKIFKPDPTPKPSPAPDMKMVEKPKPQKPKTHVIKPDLTTVTRSHVRRNSSPQKTSDDSRQERWRAEQARSLVENLTKNFNSPTEVEMPGTSSVSYASYASVIKSIYTRAWTPPDNAANDEANTKVKITVARDGTVISARIIAPSGDASVDDSVQRTLDRVTFIAPFPEGATEKEKTFIINFNLKAKRMLG